MNPQVTKLSVPLLRWTLGLAVLLQSFEFVFSASAAHSFAKTGLASWLRPALGGVEIIAAILFLVPFTALLGGYLLLVILALAVLIHLLHGQFGVEGLVVYAMATLVCLTHTEKPISRGAP
jgi:hypothetical protein